MQWVNKALSSVSPSHHGSSPSSFSAAYNQINMEELSQAEDNSLLADAEAISHADLDPNDSDDDDSVLRDVEATIFKSQPPIPISSDKPEISRLAFFFWVGVNCIATLGIVLVNKQILGNPTLRGAPTLFVAYHFFLTSATLHIASSSFVGAFERKISPLVQLLPLAFVFAGHTVVTNWSLALLEVAIYQEIRILVTPMTVIINFVAYKKTISWQSLFALFVVCTGIGLTVYSDTLQKLARQQALAEATSSDITTRTLHYYISRSLHTIRATGIHSLKNSPIGYFFGMGGVFLSALYTVWMGVYLKKLQVTSMQLLHVQAPLGCVLLLIMTPFLDIAPIWRDITSYEYLLLIISGLCAVLINMSQFFIVAGSSALSSTVVGHFKTVLIVSVGWVMATSSMTLGSGTGILIAIVGIFGYSAIGLRESKK